MRGFRFEGCFYIWIFTFGIETIKSADFLSAHTHAPSPGSQSFGHIHKCSAAHSAQQLPTPAPRRRYFGDNGENQEINVFQKQPACVGASPVMLHCLCVISCPCGQGMWSVFHSGNKAEPPARVFHYTTHPA